MASPYNFIRNGSLYVVPINAPVGAIPPAQSIEKPREFSLWVNGQITEPATHLDHARMPPSMYQEIRDDLVRFSPITVSRSAFRRSDHSYVGVIDSKGTPYRFTLDSRGMSVREADPDDFQVWKQFDQLVDDERSTAAVKRRAQAADEVGEMDRELAQPLLVINKALPALTTDLAKHTGVMVALHLPVAEAEAVALPGGEKPSSLHVTLAYLGKTLTDEQKTSAVHAVQRFARQAGPIKATLGGVGRFSASSTSDGKDVVYLSVDSPDITRLRAKLLDELAAEGLTPSTVHGFVPHITLKYIDVSDEMPIKRAAHMPVVFHYISVCIGTLRLRFPFTPGALVQKSRFTINKALPKKPKEEKTKKTPNIKASKKKTGKTGKTRYSYPQENKKPGAKAGGKQQPLLVIAQHDDSKHADPGEFANQLGVSVRTLQYTAKKLGREGFTKFMRSHLKRFAAKHRLDPDYWSTLYAKLMPGVQS